MAFLTLNDVEVPVLDGTASIETNEIGERVRVFDGQLFVSRQTTKERFDFEATPQLAATALAYRGLVLGLGHRWSFDSVFYSSKGLGPNAGFGATLDAGSAKYGAKGLTVSAASTIVYATGFTGDWTSIIWFKNAGVWEHWIFLSDGTKYKNGVLDVGATAWHSMSAGSLTLTTGIYDDLAILPYKIPTTWITSLYTRATTKAFTELPALEAGGDVIRGGAATVSVAGQAGQLKLKQGVLSGQTFKSNLHCFSFGLDEI